jgi:hypothetical protein
LTSWIDALSAVVGDRAIHYNKRSHRRKKTTNRTTLQSIHIALQEDSLAATDVFSMGEEEKLGCSEKTKGKPELIQWESTCSQSTSSDRGSPKE